MKSLTDNLCKLRDQLRSAVYMPVCQLHIDVWSTTEPLTFIQRTRGKHRILSVGETWGEQLFDCAWMRFSSKVPECDPFSLVARIDINGELCIVDALGVPLRGLTNKSSEFAPSLGKPGKDICPLDPDHIQGDRIEIWGDAGFNDLFGSLRGEGRIETAELCHVREDIRALFYDFEVLCELLDEQVSDISICEKVREQMELAAAELETGFDRVAIGRAREIIEQIFNETRSGGKLTISAVGHGHLDLAWLWPIRETKRKGARTLATALRNTERYPGYVFGCSQPQLFQWMKEDYPVLYDQIKLAVAEGRIELQGTFWVEPDCNIPNGESLIRQILYGRKFFRDEFGKIPEHCWQPDVFGYNGQLPQILSKSGHKVFMTQKLSWNAINRFPHHSFNWIGIDGSSIPTHMLAEETYNSPAAPRSVKKIRDEYAERDISNHALMVFGIGDGGGGPGEEHLERLQRLKNVGGLPAIEMRSSEAFFELWLNESHLLPEWNGELYLEKHQGTYTTQARVKRYNRLCETRLRELEFVAVVAEWLGEKAYPTDALDLIWKEVLLYQFHDVLPGSSIKRVYDECNPRYETLLKQIEELTVDTYNAILETTNLPGGNIAFNALNWRREEWIKQDGYWYFASLPSMGWAQLIPIDNAGYEKLICSTDRLENACLRVDFNANGTIRSIFNKATCLETIGTNTNANEFRIIPDYGDAWDFDVESESNNVWKYLEETVVVPELESSCAWIDGPRGIVEQTYRYGESTIWQCIHLDSGSHQLVFNTKVNWQEKATMLRVAFPANIVSDTARFEIPFGSVHRSALDDSMVDKAQLEVPAQQWVDLSDQKGGVALFNDCKYGFRVKGQVIDMCLIRSVPHPKCAVIEVGDSGNTKSPDESIYTDIGEHEFSYALMPHNGKLDEATLTQYARALNSPIRVVKNKVGSTTSSAVEESFVSIEGHGVELSTCKKAEDGDGVIIRLVNLNPTNTEIAFSTALPFKHITEVDLTEEKNLAELDVKDGKVSLMFDAFEIKTLLLKKWRPEFDGWINEKKADS
ncbi:alpha-mannosidase [Rubellicoccus peritrichatus]|uniref:Glycoside hydrolase family 38 C-terminal domain-containing protein n=1 Tax=Rubellicoccus peritrichatus TaxID=3080537 RepID=A0AAQ3QPW5_9BACT|nr:glycoside hydrolase family 38 C-terminal domain-containing protein [Puniceicoccus sp. CR14]WOO39548.1 glycoside hydrolase family 38 C-terminal domain-containing protein [Puniceicoccus sp. CR14]